METVSILVQFWYSPDGQLRLKLGQLSDLDGTEVNLQIKEGSFLIRVSSYEHSNLTRCYIRHIATGREAYLQIGPALTEFVRACLLNPDQSGEAGTAH